MAQLRRCTAIGSGGLLPLGGEGLLGDTGESDITGTMRNAHRDWAKRALAAIERLPPWTDKDFSKARDQLQRPFSTKRQFWDYLAGPQP
ncbi:MAG TPA: hypothetical protein VFI31_05600 [Pirellulales bacterium]|nr:hypothetical protein [Pirellulales bacterium]